MVPTSERFHIPTPPLPPCDGAGLPALARCEECHPPETEHIYLHLHQTASAQPRLLVCGARGCARPATVVWLAEPEHHRYVLGERSFRLARSSARVNLK